MEEEISDLGKAIEINKALMELHLGDHMIELEEHFQDEIQEFVDYVNSNEEIEENKYTLDYNDEQHRYVKIDYDGELLLFTSTGWVGTNIYY